MSEPEWQLLGSSLAKAQSATGWWIGDWWSFGEHRYGDRKALVEGDDWQGPSFQTCMNTAAVATAFETSRRREVLSFSHHAEVAGLSAEEADDLLNWAEEPIEMTGRARSVRALRDEKQRREHQRGQQIVVPFRDAPVTPRASAVAATVVSGEPEPMAVRSVVVRINTPPSTPSTHSYPRYSAGIPPDRRADMFRAFERAGRRHRAGLTIALEDSSVGGLRVRITVPT